MPDNTNIPESKAKAKKDEEQVPELATAKQVAALEKLGIAFDQPLSKQEASHLIEKATRELDEQRKQNLREEVEIKRLALEKVKVEKDIEDSGLETEVTLELARIRGCGRSAGRKTGLSK